MQPEVGRSDYLQCRRGRWFVRLRVPAHLIPGVGQTHLVRSLDTTDEAVARQRRWVALAELWRWVGSQTVSDGWAPAWAACLTGIGGHQDAPALTVPDLIKPDWGQGPLKVRSPRSTTKTPKEDLSVATMMERWLKEIEGEHTRQTIAQHRVAINHFTAFHPGKTPVRDVGRRTAG